MFGITNVQRIASTYNSGDYAYINCLYPVGSTITCGNGSYTRAAADSIGVVIFGVPEAGSWTITCTNGVKTVSKTVEITSSGQIEIIKLAYEVYYLQDGEQLVTFKTYAVAQSKAGTGSDLYHWLWTGSVDYTGDKVYTQDAISVGLNTKYVMTREVRLTSTGSLAIWDGTTTNPTNNNTLCTAAITANATSVELNIPSGHETIKIGIILGGGTLAVRNLYLT